MQREWRRKSICRVYGEGRVYAERMEKANYMQSIWKAGKLMIGGTQSIWRRQSK
jgi:hypothetical protein